MENPTQAPYTVEFISEYLYEGELVDLHLFTFLDRPYSHYDKALSAVEYFLAK
jgi:hypothetical protein